MNLKDKVALVTGTSRGIGRAIAISLAERGCHVGINFRREQEKAREVLRIIKSYRRDAVLLRADVSKYDQVKAMVDALIRKFGQIDILINNAGIITLRKPIADISEDEWDSIINTNLKGTFNCCKAVVPHMIRQGGGKIINISSTAGRRGEEHHRCRMPRQKQV